MLFEDRLRPTPRQYVRIVRVAVFALSAIIVTGAAVRLTGSGLGCTDWPLCEEGQPVAPLEFHPMVEFVNRLITGLVSASVIVAVLGSLRRRPRRRDLTRWSLALVVGVIAQIIIGAFVTLSELRYSVVAVHFLVSMVLVWAAMVLAQRAGDPTLDEHHEDARRRSRRRFTGNARAAMALMSAVLVAGAVVTSAGAHAGARTDHDGNEIAVERLPVDIGQATRIHSVLVWMACLVILTIVVSARRHGGRQARDASQLLMAVIAQGAIGYVQYFTGVPALMVGFHVAGATLVWILTIRLAYSTSVAITADEPAVAIGESSMVPS